MNTFIPSTPQHMTRKVRPSYGVPISETPVFALSVLFFAGIGALTAWTYVDEWLTKRKQAKA
jgi:hypothetical protein